MICWNITMNSTVPFWSGGMGVSWGVISGVRMKFTFTVALSYCEHLLLSFSFTISAWRSPAFRLLANKRQGNWKNTVFSLLSPDSRQALPFRDNYNLLKGSILLLPGSSCSPWVQTSCRAAWKYIPCFCLSPLRGPASFCHIYFLKSDFVGSTTIMKLCLALALFLYMLSILIFYLIFLIIFIGVEW